MESGLEKLLGVWWYNDGRSYYKIVRGEDISPGLKNTFQFYQRLNDGKELTGAIGRWPVTTKDLSIWSFGAVLSNEATIAFRLLSENSLRSAYMRKGSEAWNEPTTAVRGEEPEAYVEEEAQEPKDEVVVVGALEKRWSLDGRAYTKAQFIQFFGGVAEWDAAPRMVEGEAKPKIYTWRGEEQDEVCMDAVSRELRRLALGVLGEDEEENLSAEVAGAASLRRRLRKAAVALGSRPSRVLDVMLPLPMQAKVREETLDRVEEERLNKKDPKKTIVPVPVVRLMPTLAHPVSPNEEQMLRLFVGDPSSNAYSLAQVFRLQAPLDPLQLEFCHSLIIKRHDVLRSAFWLEGVDPLRRVSQENQGPLFVMAVKNEGEMHQCFAADHITGHQLGVTPIRCAAYCSHLSTGGIHFNMHHVVADADAMGLYMSEVVQIQALLSVGFSEEAVAERLPQLPVQFVDYAYWQKSLSSQGLIDDEMAYWFHQVTACAPPAVLDLPIDKPRPRGWVAVGASQRLMYENELLSTLTQTAGRGGTPFGVALSTMTVAWSRFNHASSTLIAVPFALRSMPELSNLIGNFLNMMPVRASHGEGETYVSTMDRTSAQGINVQKYSLAPFLSLLNQTQKHYAMQDPSRNAVYATMMDLVPNESEDPSTGLSGVLDCFLFVNTRNGLIWSMDAVYNTLILGQQTVKMILLHLKGLQYHVTRSPKEPVPRQLPCPEEVDASDDGVLLTHVYVQSGFLPQVIGVKSGWEVANATQDYMGVRAAWRFKRMSGLELTADYPPAALSSLRPPGPGAGLRGPGLKPRVEARTVMDEASMAKAVRLPTARSEAEVAEEAEARSAELARRKQRSYEVAARWAETARQSELIPLGEEDEEGWDPYATTSEVQDWHLRKYTPKGENYDSATILGGRRKPRSTAAGRGRAS